MFYEILDKTRLEILPYVQFLKSDFYLAGGTALALQLGHRDSVDFDFFTSRDFNPNNLYEKIREKIPDYTITKTQEEKNTLTVLIRENIKFSFFSYDYKLIKDSIKEDYICLASIEDIACMKLLAILSRATNKDYIDLYYILQHYELEYILSVCKQKFPEIDINLILKSLIYFKDVESEPIKFKRGSEIDFEQIKSYLIDSVKRVNY